MVFASSVRPFHGIASSPDLWPIEKKKGWAGDASSIVTKAANFSQSLWEQVMYWALCNTAGLGPLDRYNLLSFAVSKPFLVSYCREEWPNTERSQTMQSSISLFFFFLRLPLCGICTALRAEQNRVWMCESLYIYMFTLCHKKITVCKVGKKKLFVTVSRSVALGR